jgi:hypothetical protein
MSFPLNHALLFKPVDDARDGAVRETDGLAQLLKTETLTPNQRGHHEPLWASQMSARKLRLQALPHQSLNGVDTLLSLLRERSKLAWGVVLPWMPMLRTARRWRFSFHTLSGIGDAINLSFPLCRMRRVVCELTIFI